MNNLIDIRITELSVTEPLTLTEVKTHLHLTDSDNDTELTSLITQCRRAIENYCNISLVYKRILLIADLEREWELPLGPVIGIESIQQGIGVTGSAPNAYQTKEDGFIVDGLDFLKFTPAGCVRYKLQYTVGMSPVPDDLKLAILNELAYRYEHKGEEFDKKDINDTEAIGLALPYKRMAWL